MALIRRLLLALLLCASVARAETPAEPAPSASITPPEPTSMPEIEYPASAPPGAGIVSVKLHLTIGIDGQVTHVALIEGGGEAFNQAVIEGVKRFRFTPAQMNGQPVEVVLPFTHTFVPASPPVEEAKNDPTLNAVIEGLVEERGTRKPVKNVTVVGLSNGHEYLATTDEQGHFRLPIAAGELEIRVVGFGYRKFLQKEKIGANEQLKLRYLLERESYDPYETVILSKRERTEISRMTLKDRELTRVPGTFGDPYKVITVLPGVTSAMSLLPLPIVRGSSPGNTGIFLDNVRLPLLFHLFAGPSVVHPEFVDHIDFNPGGFPVQFGGYTGGIVSGETRRARADERKIDLDINSSQAGLFLREAFPKLGLTATAAGRIGYPGVLLSLVSPDVSLSYWDYQLRLDGHLGRGTWTAFFFGANDQLSLREPPTDPNADPHSGPMKPYLRFKFHRGDLRYRLGDEDHGIGLRLVGGYDESLLADETSSWTLNPQLRANYKFSDALRLRSGLDANARTMKTKFALSDEIDLSAASNQSGAQYSGGVFTDLLWKPRESLLVIPGVRADLYRDGAATKWNVDPRLMVRYRLTSDENHGVWLKGAVGRYHQPPRFFLPMPGADQGALSNGLLATTQVSVGTELTVASGVELDLQTYYNHMDPVFFDLSTNLNASDLQTKPPTAPPGQAPPPSTETFNPLGDRFTTHQKGRSYGVEMLIRKRDSKQFFGWISYTLSRSERLDQDGWVPFDFDRTHILNLVAGVHLPRNWEVGGRLLLQSGTPLTTIVARNSARTGPQMRFDLRVDKRVVYDRWLFDFYVDVVNATVAEESGGLVGNEAFRYVLPSIGFRAVL